MKHSKILILLMISFLLSCKGGDPIPPYVYNANPHYAWGYAEFYGAYYADNGIKNNTLTVSLFSDSLTLTDNGELVGYGQFLFLEDVFVVPSAISLTDGKYTINETGEPFTAFAGVNKTIDDEVYTLGSYITYYEENATKSKIKLISKGSFDVKMINDTVCSIVCDFKTSDSLQLKGSFEAVLPHFDQSLNPSKFVSRNKYKFRLN